MGAKYVVNALVKKLSQQPVKNTVGRDDSPIYVIGYQVLKAMATIKQPTKRGNIVGEAFDVKPLVAIFGTVVHVGIRRFRHFAPKFKRLMTTCHSIILSLVNRE